MANTKNKKKKKKNRRTTATCQSLQFPSAGTCPASVFLPRRIRVVYTDPDATDFSEEEDDDDDVVVEVLDKKLVSRMVFIPPEYHRLPLASKTTSLLRQKPPAKRRENQPRFQDGNDGDVETDDDDACSLPDDDINLDSDSWNPPDSSLDLNGRDSPMAFPAIEPLDRVVTCNAAVPMHGQEEEDQHHPLFPLHTFSPCSVLETCSSGVVAGSESPCSMAWPLSPEDYYLTNYDHLFVPESCSTLAPALSPLDFSNEGPYLQDVDFDQAADWWLPVI